MKCVSSFINFHRFYSPGPARGVKAPGSTGQGFSAARPIRVIVFSLFDSLSKITSD